ncbi:MAG: 2-C-methyl-D-erythritol 4-phosphate cytidylyltransferase [Bacteroidales bacterium]|nr:2-C-methyl-D-erythritol 4-phosphate cytidylyltransferase [Bacteroidales bacterium]
MKYVIITAGGTGKRMETELPKQFLEISGKPILMHTISRFFNYDNNLHIILSLPEKYLDFWKELCEKYSFNIPHNSVKGGKTRFHSIKNALKEVAEDGFVAVHDGVRPLVSNETIKRSFLTAEKYGNAVASQKIVFSLRKKERKKTITVNRDLYFEIQTPQIFKVGILKKAYKQNYQDIFTDDASVVEAYGEEIFLTKGNRENIKITTPADLKIAEALLNTVI